MWRASHTVMSWGSRACGRRGVACRSVSQVPRVHGCARRRRLRIAVAACGAQFGPIFEHLVEKTGIPFLPMSMAKGLLPDTHPQCAGADYVCLVVYLWMFA